MEGAQEADHEGALTMTTMIALASEQRMQNIIPLLQEGADVSEIILVASTEANQANSKFAKALEDTIIALKEMNFSAREARFRVDAYNIKAAYELLDQELSDCRNAVVNFTGGTKCMSIAAYMAARRHERLAIYVDTANERILSYQPDGQFTSQNFALRGRLTVEIYLLANGQRVDEDRTNKKALKESDLVAARELIRTWPACVNTLHELGKTVTSQSSWPTLSSSDDQTISILERIGYIQTDKQLQVTQSGRAFVTGGWLEAIVRVLLEDSGYFDHVRSNVCIGGVENELDGLATRSGQLAVIECKSGDLGGQTTLNKLQAISSQFGRFVRTFFVTSRALSEVDDAFKERARQYGVRDIVTVETLPEIAKRVMEGMRGAA